MSNFENDCCESKVCATSKCGAAHSITLPQYKSTKPQIEPDVIEPPVVIKVPVELAVIQVQVDIESDIQLECPAFEIKRIRKNLFITQCKLIPDPEGPGRCIRGGKLFLGGYIRKNIEYARADCVDKDAISGDIRHTTVYVPFECATRVYFDIPPVFEENQPVKEFETLNCMKNGSNLQEKIFRNTEVFNESIYCELLRARFDQIDIQTCPIPLKNCFKETVFKTFKEKTAIYIDLKLLQKRQVCIPSKHHKKEDNCDCD